MAPDAGSILIMFAISAGVVLAFEVGHWLLGLIFSVNVPKAEMCWLYWCAVTVLAGLCWRSALSEISGRLLCAPVVLSALIHLHLNLTYGLQIYRSRSGRRRLIRSMKNESIGHYVVGGERKDHPRINP